MLNGRLTGVQTVPPALRRPRGETPFDAVGWNRPRVWRISRAMKRIKYALYPPAEAGLPWLAVVLDGNKPMDSFGCPDADNARRVLAEMKARNEAKGVSALG